MLLTGAGQQVKMKVVHRRNKGGTWTAVESEIKQYFGYWVGNIWLQVLAKCAV